MKKLTLLFALAVIFGNTLTAKDCLEQYIAKYKFQNNNIIKEVSIIAKDGNLFLNSSWGKIAIQKTGADQFYIPGYNGMVRFKRNNAHEITGITIEIMGLVLNGAIEKPANIKSITELKSSTPSKVLLPKWFDEPDDLYLY